jgi:hypothetical protein
MEKKKSTTTPSPLPINPTPFNLKEHGAQYRRQRRSTESQHLLFVLDTSGSIGEENFNRITNVLRNMLPAFCSKIKVAVMTFDHEYYVEFCFDEYENTVEGRASAGNAIGFIPYIRPRQGPGTRWTHTAGAVNCVCDRMLNSTCGLLESGCTDVVFITDGAANDPELDVCTEIDCLHDNPRVSTFVIAIGFLDEMKLECMRDNTLGPQHYRIFKFEDFDEFENTFNDLLQILLCDTEMKYECVYYDQPGLRPRVPG